MLLNTVHFGEMEVESENIFIFSSGILGFPMEKQYVVVRNPEPGLPFDWLQSIEKPDLTFVIADPFFFKDDYEFDIPESIQENLEIWDPSEILVYAITVVAEEIGLSTINLRAPLVLNTRTKKGCQLILDNDGYPVKHRLFPGWEGGE